MAYNSLTFLAARTILANRLQDPRQVYFNQPLELENCLIESVRLFQSLTGSYKQKIAFSTSENLNYYDLPAIASVVSYNATDVEVINNVLTALLEPTLTVGWVGTGQFTFEQLQASLQNRLNRFIGETGCRVTHQLIAGPPPPAAIATLPDAVFDVRRAAWLPIPSGLTWQDIQQSWQGANFPWNQSSGAYPLGRLDEWAQQAYAPNSTQKPGTPDNYSVFGVAPLQIRMVAPPLDTGGIDCLFVQAGPTVNLNPAVPVVLMIPDDLSPALKWGVLADILGTDGPSRDYARAAYCEQRYKEFVQIARIYPSTLTADINNISCGVGSVFDMDYYMPNWQQMTGTPTFVGMCGRNLACIGMTPDTGDASNDYGVGLVVAANAPVDLTSYVQVGRDQIDPIIDYAQHIASFKMGGAEFDGTLRLFENLISCAKSQNGRLDAVAFYKTQLQQPAAKSEMEAARMVV